jgi:heme oxygenase (biliverdin-IX-beta and delta-forming)
MVIDTVRTETKRQHQELEGVLIPVLKKMTDANAYAALLRMFYGYYQGIEDATDKYLNDDIVPRYSSRGKGERILQDLRSLGITDTPPISTNLPEINSVATALGAMYVLEGSSLGGQIITRMLMDSLKMPLEHFKFYNCYGEESKAYWEQYVDALNNSAASMTEDEREIIVNTAKDTFARFKEIALQNLPSLSPQPA